MIAGSAPTSLSNACDPNALKTNLEIAAPWRIPGLRFP